MIYRFSMQSIRSLYGEEMYQKAVESWPSWNAVQLHDDCSDYLSYSEPNHLKR